MFDARCENLHLHTPQDPLIRASPRQPRAPLRTPDPEEPVHLKQIAADVGISESCLTNWMKTADVEAGIKLGTTAAVSQELREAKRRVRLLEQENEVLRRVAAYLSQANLPGKGGTRSCGTSPLTAFPSRWRGRVLKIARQPYYRWLKNPVTDAELAEAGLPGQRPV